MVIEIYFNIYGQEVKVSIWVIVRVLDVNDYKFEFYNCSFLVCIFIFEEV